MMKKGYGGVLRLGLAITCSALLLACQAGQVIQTTAPTDDSAALAMPALPEASATGAQATVAPIGATASQTINYVYSSPQADAKYVPPGTSIAIRFDSDVLADQLQPGLFDIEGDQSGPHDGTVVLSDDQRTIIFKPADPFMPGESVSVSFEGGSLGANGEQLGDVNLKFNVTSNPSPVVSSTVSSVSEAATPQKPAPSTPQPVPASASRYATAPGTLPLITVTNHMTHTADDYIFLNTSSKKAAQYLMILDASGTLVYYKELQNGVAYTDFKQQPNGLLTYFEGASTPDGGGAGVYRVLDATYNVVDSYAAGDGYIADSHDLRLLPNGHALLTIYDYQIRDMSAYGGKPKARFIDLLVQELDRAKNVVFEWKASEHLPFTDTYEPLTGNTVDPYHGNSIEMLPDGNLLVSFRHLSQVVKVDRQMGDVIWRMGGKNSDFKFVNDAGFSYQHDVRLLPDGHMTVFDNGNQHKPQVSRAVEYEVDEASKTVTRVWAYQHEPAIYGSYMGDAQRLPDGNTFIGWGGPRPIASEVTSDGQLVRDIELNGADGVVYRWFQMPWTGEPDTAPTLVVQSAGVTTTLYYSWNGATDVGAYRIEAGQTQDQFTPLKSENKQGFETTTVLTSAQARACYYRVMAVDKAGADMRYSNVITSTAPGCG